ncbi:hypothetical protein GQ44DRAFT_323029 [Phaeosphaeriaceae sp. PMI808]|nr:hypothetical protein GQ44DRAFT_323029 [Phaeosphaeriaceae sp. PMI808]
MRHSIWGFFGRMIGIVTLIAGDWSECKSGDEGQRRTIMAGLAPRLELCQPHVYPNKHQASEKLDPEQLNVHNWHYQWMTSTRLPCPQDPHRGVIQMGYPRSNYRSKSSLPKKTG